MSSPEHSNSMFMGLTKFQFLGVLVVILALSTIAQAWTIYSVTHLTSTQKSLCHLVAQADQSRTDTVQRLLTASRRDEREADLKDAEAEALKAVNSTSPFIHSIIRAWHQEARVARQTGQDLHQQAVDTASAPPVRLGGC